MYEEQIVILFSPLLPSLAHLFCLLFFSCTLNLASVARSLFNDAFVMDAWSKAGNAEEIMMLSDGNCELANAMGVTMDGSGIGLGTRSRRYSLVAEDGKITVLNLEQGGAFEVSSAEAILEAL